jgi:hypothetical protein
MGTEPLVCPRCATTYPLEDRFCRECGMPLVYHGTLGVDAVVSERQARARKIKPQYGEGDLVKVAQGRNQVEAEFIQGLLLEEGVPSLLRRAAGFDVPDFLTVGPRDVLVPQAGVAAAREVLLESEIGTTEPSAAAARPPVRMVAAGLAACAIVPVIALLVHALLS